MEREKGFEACLTVNANLATVHAFPSILAGAQAFPLRSTLSAAPRVSPPVPRLPGDIRETERRTPPVRMAYLVRGYRTGAATA